MKTKVESIKILLALFFMSTVITLNYQVFGQTDANYYHMCATLDTFFQVHPGDTAEQDGDYMQYIRWKEFWRNRVYSDDTSQNGSFDLLRRAWDQYVQNINNYSGSGLIYNNWKFDGPDSLKTQNNGLVSAVYVDTLNDTSMKTIYIGSSTAGMWKTIDGGINWENITDASNLFFVGISDIKGDPNNPNILYAATGGQYFLSSQLFGNGIIRSIDYGLTWNVIYPTNPNNVPGYNFYAQKVMVDPYNSQRIWALVRDHLIRSNDFGLHWDTIFISPHDTDFYTGEYRFLRDIEMKPGDNNILYIGTDDYDHKRAQAWKIENATSTSPLISRIDNLFPNNGPINSERFEIAVSPVDPEAIFVCCTDIMTGHVLKFKIWKFENMVWSKIFEQFNDDFGGPFGGCDYYKLELLVSPTDTSIIYVGGCTFDKIQQRLLVPTYHVNYTYLSDFYHVDTRCAKIIRGSLPIQHGNHDIIFVGNDGGVSKTTNGGLNGTYWTNLNGKGLSLTQVYGIGSSNQTPYWLGGGCQDNFFTLLNDNQWQNTGGGDMGDAVVDYHQPNIIYSHQWAPTIHVVKSFDFGKNWAIVNFPIYQERWSVGLPVRLNPKNPSTIYTAGIHLFISYDGGNSYTTKSTGEPLWVEPACALEIAPNDTSIYYLAYSNPVNVSGSGNKLLKSIDGGDTWAYITPGQTYTLGITGIAVSRTNSDFIWITFGGFESSPGLNRVLFSSNGGQSWTDYSDGLPNMPVNCITYKKGSNDGLFVGTDVGVFYRDKNLSNWEALANGLPKCVISDIEYIDTIDVLRVSTYGRGIWETDLHSCSYDPNKPLLIQSDISWVNDTVVANDILVKKPSTLTIKCIVKFPVLGRIQIEPGAKVIVDGGVLTNACSGMWRGVEVWGNGSQPELQQYQGYIELKNGALVENARISITTNNADANGNIDWNSTGGIIYASNTTFKNNFKAIQFLSYPFQQASSFTNVTFKTSGNFSDLKSSPSDFVSLWLIKGVRFKGCKFINENTDSRLVPLTETGRGIYSINGGYSINSLCLNPNSLPPCSDFQPSYFSGLRYGVKALDSDPTYSVNIDQSNFFFNYRNIYLSGMNTASITRDSLRFSQRYEDPSNPNGYENDTMYGLYLNNCTGYKVEENRFLSDLYYFAIHNVLNIGIIVNNSGPDANEIYNNSFSTLKYGIIAQDINHDRRGIGLCIRCNDDTITAYDQAITHRPGPVFSEYGIAANQGDSLSEQGPAGNTFDNSSEHTDSDADIQNIDSFIWYWFHDPNTTSKRVDPTHHTTYSVEEKPTGYVYNKITACPSKINTGGGKPNDLKIEIAIEQSAIDSIINLLDQRIDGGNTGDLSTTVQTSTPPQALDLHQNLLGKSPYLSDSVIKTAISKEDVLPNEMIRDVLVANPQSAKSIEVLGKLDERFVPMPDSMMVEIMEGIDKISSKESLEALLAVHMNMKNVLFNELIRLYENDTSSASLTDSIITVLQNDKVLTSKYRIVFEYLNKNDPGSAQSALENIPQSFTFDEQQTLQYHDYLTYFGILFQLKSDGKNILEVDQTQVNQLMELKTQAQEPIQTYATNILLANGKISYNEPIYLPDDSTKSSKINREYKTSKLIQKSYFKIFPNPAKQYVILEYNLKNDFGEKPISEFSIYALDGKIVYSWILSKKQDQVLIETTLLSPGIYVCLLKINGKNVQSVKFTIIK